MKKHDRKFMTDLVRWLKDAELYHDSHAYSDRQWRDRGENYGGKSIFTLTAEGSSSLNRIFNYQIPGDHVIRRQFDAFVKQQGYWYEMGYSWSWHFYRL